MTFFTSTDGTAPIVLTVPGLGIRPLALADPVGGGAPRHASRRVGHVGFTARNAWVTKLDQAIRAAQAPVVLAAHSLGCLAVAWWAELAGQPFGWPVAGALLVAPPDIDRADAPAQLATFRPAPSRLLPFPSILVGEQRRSLDRRRARPRAGDGLGQLLRRGGAAGPPQRRERNRLVGGRPCPARPGARRRVGPRRAPAQRRRGALAAGDQRDRRRAGALSGRAAARLTPIGPPPIGLPHLPGGSAQRRWRWQRNDPR